MELGIEIEGNRESNRVSITAIAFEYSDTGLFVIKLPKKSAAFVHKNLAC
jgi:hypothetical protein